MRKKIRKVGEYLDRPVCVSSWHTDRTIETWPGDGCAGCCPSPEEEDPGDQAVQHDGQEQRHHVENGEVNEVNGKVELPLHPVSTLHVAVRAHLNGRVHTWQNTASHRVKRRRASRSKIDYVIEGILAAVKLGCSYWKLCNRHLVLSLLQCHFIHG